MWWSVAPKGEQSVLLTNHKLHLDFPDVEECQNLRHHWILVRNDRPLTPSPVRTKMPEQVKKNPLAPWRQKEEQARLYSVYMRPWTLVRSQATKHVPHLADLNQAFPTEQQKVVLCLLGRNIEQAVELPRLSTEKILRSKQNVPTFARAWKWYCVVPQCRTLAWRPEEG